MSRPLPPNAAMPSDFLKPTASGRSPPKIAWSCMASMLGCLAGLVVIGGLAALSVEVVIVGMLIGVFALLLVVIAYLQDIAASLRRPSSVPPAPARPAR